mgnify:CR=1 FL=1
MMVDAAAPRSISCLWIRRVTSSLIMLALASTCTNLSLVGHTVGAIRPVEWRLDHGWQLQLLIVGVVALLTAITLTGADHFLVQLDNVLWSTRWPRRIWNATRQIYLGIGIYWVVKAAASTFVSSMSLSSLIKLVKMTWSMHDRMPSIIWIVTTLLLCIWVEIMKVGLAKLTVLWACQWINWSVALSNLNFWCSVILGCYTLTDVATTLVSVWVLKAIVRLHSLSVWPIKSDLISSQSSCSSWAIHTFCVWIMLSLLAVILLHVILVQILIIVVSVITTVHLSA